MHIHGIKPFRTAIRPTVLLMAGILTTATLLAGCNESKPSTNKGVAYKDAATSALAQSTSAADNANPKFATTRSESYQTGGAQSVTSTKLGDLSEFKSIAMDAADLVKRGDLSAAKNLIKDLEISWDVAEAGLKPRAVDDWHLLDDAIDDTLSALRESNPNESACNEAMAHLVQTFDALQHKA